MQGMVKQRSVDEVFGAVVFPAHACSVNIFRRWVRVFPTHVLRETTAPLLKVEA